MSPDSPQDNADRFERIADNYGELFTEVFLEQGLDYAQLEQSVFDHVSKIEPAYRELALLDIGVGDGATSAAFVDAGCTRLTGIDLNPAMLDAARTSLGDSMQLLHMSATDMRAFEEGTFEIIVSGATIHNIPRVERVGIWAELVRLLPRTFVCADKIKDPEASKHRADYEREVAAIRTVYGERHGLQEAANVWVRHYEDDEREALTFNELQSGLGEKYDLSIVFEIGLYKTVVARRRA